jgi:two-component system, OmpR family, response regulator
MAQSRVVIVTNDDWISQLIAASLREGGSVVSLCSSAEEALERLNASAHDAVLCDAVLPDHDAAWLVAGLRMGPHASTTFVVLAHADDSFSRLEALHAGADACMLKPFKVDEVCLQLEALVAMGRRFAASSVTGTPSPPESAPNSSPISSRAPASRAGAEEAFSGDLAQLSLPTVLTLLELERRTGVLTVKGSKQTATVMMQGGAATVATLGGVQIAPIAVLRRVLKWKTGRFTFRSGVSMAPPSDQRSIGALLMEAVRLEDESPASSQGPASLHAPGSYSLRPPPGDFFFDEREVPTAKSAAGSGTPKRGARKSIQPPAPAPPEGRSEDPHARQTRPAPPPTPAAGRPARPPTEAKIEPQPPPRPPVPPAPRAPPVAPPRPAPKPPVPVPKR